MAKTANDVKAVTMEDLLRESASPLNIPKRGDLLEGTITQITKKMVLVDIGGKTEGVVADKEFDVARDYIDQLKVGDKVSAYVASAENERGQILLSLKRAVMDQKWEELAKKMESDELVAVRGVELNKGGMIVVIDGIRGFVPTSQFGKKTINNLDALLRKTFEVKVIEVDKEKNRLIFSERHVSEAGDIAKRSTALSALEVNKVYDGTVSGVMPFGVFVTLHVPVKGEKGEGTVDVEGLVHISEISWQKVEDPHQYSKVGESMKVKVLAVDPATGKVNLSIKQLASDPWATAQDKYAEGMVVSGVVSRMAPFGAFITLEPGIDGLIHVSKIPAAKELKAGDKVTVTVEQVDPDARRISLSLMLDEVPIGYK